MGLRPHHISFPLTRHPRHSARRIGDGQSEGARIMTKAEDKGAFYRLRTIKAPLRLLAVLCLSTALLSAASATPSVRLETARIAFEISPDTGQYNITDKTGKVVWSSNPEVARFGEVTLLAGGKRETFPLGRCAVVRKGSSLQVAFHPRPQQQLAELRIGVRVLADGKTLEFGYSADPALVVEQLNLLDSALSVASEDLGYITVPVREGLIIPADSGVAFTHEFDTYNYEGCHMEMFGVVKGGAAALVTWKDPYTKLVVRSKVPDQMASPVKQRLLPSLILRQSARSCRVSFLGKGGYMEMAKAYRDVAKERGWAVTWREKLKGHPERAKLFGAVNFKLWSTLSRQMNEESTKEESVRVHWTFDEAAQVAEHLKRDLKLDNVFFLMGGWIRRGYDNQHPDILPAAPECGGNEALADCVRRVRRLGYLVGLHDNYQDIYRDSPSWNEEFILKARDGSLVKGGHWAGGRAYLTCSRKALELAQRPQNLPAVRSLSKADAYFIDTTYAAGLTECFDPKHPLTRADDIHWKQALSDYAREVFPIFGSECGREWAIPHSDFFEGFTGVSGGYYHDAGLLKKLGATPVPLFEGVYRDCIAMYGKYGYDPAKAAEYVLHHLSIGRTLNYHSIPSHLYWKEPSPKTNTDGPSEFLRADNGWAEGMHPLDRFIKNTYEILSPLNELTSQTLLMEHEFLTPDRHARRSRFGSGADAVEVVVNASSEPLKRRSQLGGELTLPPYGFLVESRTFIAFLSLSWAGRDFESPSLFTLRSFDAKPIARSHRVRVFHGFGDPHILAGGTEHVVAREAVIDVAANSR